MIRQDFHGKDLKEGHTLPLSLVLVRCAMKLGLSPAAPGQRRNPGTLRPTVAWSGSNRPAAIPEQERRFGERRWPHFLFFNGQKR